MKTGLAAGFLALLAARTPWSSRSRSPWPPEPPRTPVPRSLARPSRRCGRPNLHDRAHYGRPERATR